MPNFKLSYVPKIDDALSMELWKHTNIGSSGFRWWLDRYRDQMIAMIVYVEDEIIGWSACRLEETWGEIGVFIDVLHRRQGIGTIAFNALLLRMKEDNRATNIPLDFDRNTCMTRFMSEQIRNFGFREFGIQAA